MKRLFILISLVTSLGAILLFVYGSPSLSAPSNRLIVGTNAEYPPYTFVEGREIVGFDIDVAEEVCRRIDFEMAVRDLPFDALIPELQTGRIDLLAAGITPTEERAKRVLFSTSYLSGDPLMAVSRTPLVGRVDWVGVAVAVNDGYTADLYLSEQEGIHLLRFTAPIDALLALQSGQVDLFVAAQSTLKQYANHQGSDGFYMAPIGAGDDSVAMGIAPGRVELLDLVNRALMEMEGDGTMEKIQQKWGL